MKYDKKDEIVFFCSDGRQKKKKKKKKKKNPKDKRVVDWPLMASPEPTFVISFAYLIIVWTLNRVMRDRAPLQLKWIAVLHNTFLVALSLYMGCEILRNAIVNEFSFVCNRVDRSDAGLPLARVLYIFYISKAYEFIDTFLMAFRKKTTQISFLHLYHHVRD
jgi:hypothetical protein